ncbi:hypothetical protein V6N11_051717 [Hibiscus sabdariffa]|uniref:Uncharacterized protein n=1 Tax=Hibiscus sabdariffa TaxID=183260 RepID=A0ABR2U884_9ROSI
MLPIEFQDVGDRWGCFGAVGMLLAAKSTLLVHMVPVRVLAYRYDNINVTSHWLLGVSVSVRANGYRTAPAGHRLLLLLMLLTDVCSLLYKVLRLDILKAKCSTQKLVRLNEKFYCDNRFYLGWLGDDCSSFSAIGLGESCSISIRLVGALPLHLAGDVWVLA